MHCSSNTYICCRQKPTGRTMQRDNVSTLSWWSLNRPIATSQSEDSTGLPFLTSSQAAWGAKSTKYAADSCSYQPEPLDMAAMRDSIMNQQLNQASTIRDAHLGIQQPTLSGITAPSGQISASLGVTEPQSTGCSEADSGDVLGSGDKPFPVSSSWWSSASSLPSITAASPPLPRPSFLPSWSAPRCRSSTVRRSTGRLASPLLLLALLTIGGPLLAAAQICPAYQVTYAVQVRSLKMVITNWKFV